VHMAHESTQSSPKGAEHPPQPVATGRAAPAVPEARSEYSPAPPRLRRLEARLYASSKAVVVTLPDGRRFRAGNGPIVAEINLRNSRAISALGSLNEGNIAQAYLAGDLDMTGDFLQLLELRSFLSDRHYLSWAWRFLEPMLFGQVKTNARAISVHYDLDPKFYLSFLDETRCYTQGIFISDDEPLHVAIRRKFDYCIETCRLGPRSHILEVGPGWGAFSEYAAKRGIRITAVTNSGRSGEFVADLGRRLGCDWEVKVDDFLTYKSAERFDAIVLMGIMEHLPRYDAVLRQFLHLLKPGGFVYLDASAARDKYKASSFIYRDIYPGNHSFFVLHDFLRAVSRTSLQVRAVVDDRHNYFLTFKHWARKFESQRKRVVADFGERNYRRFNLYLWSSAQCFLTDRLQCYRVLLEHPKQ
jgi:cyclopropane-fatty-acyl-phospholipid synthase